MNVNKEDIAHVLPMMAMDSVSDAGSDRQPQRIEGQSI